jgi:hypothetical protein
VQYIELFLCLETFNEFRSEVNNNNNKERTGEYISSTESSNILLGVFPECFRFCIYYFKETRNEINSLLLNVGSSIGSQS